MTWDDLKPEQVHALQQIVRRHGIFYHRLVKRLEELGLPPADPLYARAWHLAGNVEALRSLLDDYRKPRATLPSSLGVADVQARCGHGYAAHLQSGPRRRLVYSTEVYHRMRMTEGFELSGSA